MKRTYFKIGILFMMAFLIFCSGCMGEEAGADTTSLHNETQKYEISFIPEAEKIEGLEIVFINVGRADSALVSFNNYNCLIDTGTRESFPDLLKFLKSRNIEKLDAVFLTHTHSDHIGGLESLLKFFEVGDIYAPEITAYKKNGNNVVSERAEKAGYTVKRLVAGDSLLLDSAVEKLKFNVVGPLTKDDAEDNNNSLVMYLDYTVSLCLFTGDMEFPEEDTLMEAGNIKSSLILKVANHGNKDACSDKLVRLVSPRWSVISTDSAVDTNTPAKRVLSALYGVKSEVFSTENTEAGISAKFTAGKVILSEAVVEESNVKYDMVIESLDRELESVVLKNNGKETVDLSDWWIISERKREIFIFPEGTAINAGETISLSNDGLTFSDFFWDAKNIWNNKKEDAALLFDKFGNEVFKFTLPEIE